jgi:TIGR03009 family protein
VQKLLAYWESHTKDIQTFRCEFTRWEYDPVFGPKDRPKTQSNGKICFASPDRGLFKEEVVKHFTPSNKEGDSPTYETRPGDIGEYWVCDGKSVYEYRAQVKTVVEMKLPPEMQGSAISNSPLPFLFGAKAEELNQRYWIRELPPLSGYKAYRLEALPRTAEANDFLRAEILLDQEEFLPVAMKLEKTRHQDGTVSYSAFRFEDRQVNSATDKLANFVQLFVEPKIPFSWKKVVEDYRGEQGDSQVQLPDRGERK